MARSTRSDSRARRDAARRAGEPGGHPEDAPGDPESVARTICLRQLSIAPRTRAQLAQALARKGIPDDVAEHVLTRFSEVGLIDDATFAQAWVSSRHQGRGLARRALASELHRRGVDSETAREAVDTLDPQTEEATARALVRRKLRSLQSATPDARTRRLLGMLARKGYGAGLAYRVVRDELGAGDEAEALLDPEAPL